MYSLLTVDLPSLYSAKASRRRLIDILFLAKILHKALKYYPA